MAPWCSPGALLDGNKYFYLQFPDEESQRGQGAGQRPRSQSMADCDWPGPVCKAWALSCRALFPVPGSSPSMDLGNDLKPLLEVSLCNILVLRPFGLGILHVESSHLFRGGKSRAVPGN